MLYLEQTEEINSIYSYIDKNYKISDIMNIYRDTVGSGTNYIVETKEQSYFLKLFDLRNPKYRIFDEVVICNNLNHIKPITSVFISNNDGAYVTNYQKKIVGHLQLYFPSSSWKQYEVLPQNIMKGVAKLGELNLLLKEYELPINNLFLDLKQGKAAIQYFINQSHSVYDLECSYYLKQRLSYLQNLPELQLNSFSFLSSHSDYTPMQFLIRNDDIYRVIDFSHISTVPIAWELTRYYTQCIPAENFDRNRLIEIFDYYSTYYELSEYDYKHACNLLALQLSQSSYGFKEYLSTHDNKYLYILKERDTLIRQLLH